MASLVLLLLATIGLTIVAGALPAAIGVTAATGVGLIVLVVRHSERPAHHGSRRVNISTAGEGKPLTSSSQPRSERLHWLDNLKTALTVLVVVHHSTGCFTGSGWLYSLAAYKNWFQVFGTAIMGLNQSYFMCLFFFISAFFTPGSFDRKGTEAFLHDKFIRLGGPYLVVTCAVMPLHDFFLRVVVLRQPYRYFPNPGPAWFLVWLLIFNTGYVLLKRESNRRRISAEPAAPTTPAMAQPGLGWLMLLSVPTGVVMAVLCAVTGPSLAGMPMTIGALLFDIAMFVGGILAKEHGWLQRHSSTTPSAAPLRSHLLPLTPSVVLTVAMSLAAFGVTAWYYLTDQAFMSGSVFVRVGANNTMEAADSTLGGERVVALLCFFAYFGVATPVISVAMLAVFQRCFNYTTRLTRFLSSAAYAVYLIHPLVVTPMAYVYTVILRRWAGIAIEYAYLTEAATSRIAVSGTSFGPDWRVFIGWLFVVVSSLLIVWPAAHYFRRLPYVNRVL